MFTSLRLKLAAWYVAASLLVVLVLGVTVVLLETRALNHRLEGSIRSAGDAVKAATASNQQSNQSLPPLEAATMAVETVVGHRWLSSNDVFAVLLDEQGRVVANPENVNAAAIGEGASIERARVAGEDWHTTTVSGTELRVKTSPLLTAEGELIGFVQAGKSMEDSRAAMQTLVLVLAGSGAFALALFSLGGYFLAGKAISPVEQSYERQRQFVADASHELRTPLAVIRTSAGTLGRQPGHDPAVDDIDQEAQYMSRLIDDLLLLASSDQGRLRVEKSTFDLRDLVEEAAKVLLPLAEESGLELKSETGELPIPASTDAQHLRNALLILCENALKFTPAGGRVTIAARRQGAEAVIEVRDTGVGMTREVLSRATDRFFTASKARTRTKGGAGLGLSIAQQLMTILGGRLELQSEQGAGTSARLVLPAAASGPVSEPGRGSVAQTEQLSGNG